uniref:non-specific serine/threonine protein kinase n=1 Tax=Callorhinchus milii TaxID=7868 RepID=A0A4W3IE35_CALMI
MLNLRLYKEVDKFRRLIRTPETIEQLDRNSESRHSKQLNWDTVFRSLQRYIQKETECLQAAKVSLSAATQANRQKKMQEISSLLKYFIRWANKRGPRLKCQDLLKHIMDILQDKFSCAAYGTDYSSILLKDMLSVRKYWCEISQEQWSDLITLYFKMHLKPSGNTNRVLVARIIHTLVRGCCIQSKGLTSKLFEFFSKAMQSARQEQVFAVLEHIMAALNVFLNVCAMNCRIRLCKLGEEIFPTLLYIWTQKRPQDSLKEEIVEFFRLQLHAHHPKGARSQEKADWPKWQSLLYNLYDTLVSEVNHIGSRGKYSAGSRHVAVKDNLIDLAADICHQVKQLLNIKRILMEIDSTQSASPQGTPSKRRRIELGWEVIRENLQKSQSDFDMIPWLQITTTLIAKYPSGVPSCELVPILTVLHQILSQQRRGERTPYVLWCLSEMATCQQLKSDLRPAQRLDLQKLWAKIWIITLRCISSQQTEIRGFWLLGAILQGGLTVPDKDFWKIFSGSTCKPSSAAAECLLQALIKYTLPELMEGIGEYSADDNGTQPLREAIMRWLLTYCPEEDMEENAELPSVVSRLVCNGDSVSVFPSVPPGEGPARDSRGGIIFSEIEHLFLQTTFDATPNYASSAVAVRGKGTVTSRISVKHVLKEKLEEYLLALVERLHSTEAVPPECLVRCADLITGVLRYYCDIDVIADEDVCTSALFQKAKSLMLDAGECISTARNKFNEESKLASLRILVTLCTNCLHSHSKSILAEENLTKHDVLLLDAVRFLCCCTAAGQKYVLSFRPGDIQRKLLVLIQEHDLQAPKSLYLHMYLILLQELPSEESIIPVNDISMLLKQLLDVCSFYRSDQEVCSAVLTHLLPLLKAQGIDSDEMADVQGKLLKAIGAFWYVHLSKEGKCNAQVRAALVRCMTALLETDPHSKWTTLLVRNEELSVSEVYSEFLADSHHQVRMLAAMSVNRLFQEVQLRDSVQLKALPIKLQQKAFENVYLKVQEGMKLQLHYPQNPDEECNRRATLLVLISSIICCSPVCEKQALFAICQSLKENKLDPKLVKKVLETLSTRLTYRSLENFIVSHLDYLIHEWLKMGYSLPTFPYVLLNCSSLKEFYRSYYKILVPHLTIVGNLEEVKSIGVQIKREWKEMLADCLPKIMVNILPCFAYQGRDGSGNDTYTAQQRENASKVFDMLNDDHCLGKQNIDQLSHNNLPEIVVELLNTLYDSPDQEAAEDAELVRFAGALDPAPNPPYFPSSVILAAFDYISGCHKEKLKSLVAIISKTPDSIQKILLAICRKAVETSSAYEKHRILRMYRLFVNLLLKAIKYGGLGGTWAFVLRDVIYTLIHHINSRPSHMDDVSARSFSLCCDLLNVTCHTAVEHCGDALESHLHVIVATLAPLVQEQAEVRQQALELLRYLVITNQDNENLHHAIKRLDPFPDLPEFRELRFTQEKIKYSKGRFTLLKEICHFLSVSSCDSLPLTRLEGLNDLKKQLEQHKQDIKQLLKDILVRLVVNLLQLCKSAINHPAGKDILEAAGSCLGEVGPVDFSTIALQHKKDELHSKAMEVFKENKFQLIFILLNVINNALIDQGIEVRFAAATCAKNILATQSGHQFWDQSKTDPNGPDPMLMYLQPFRTAKKKVSESPEPPHTLDDSTLWIPQSGCHESWLKTLTCSLLDSGGVISEGLRLIKPMCEVKTDFCQLVLPYLIHDILLHDSHSSWRVLLSKHIQGFFNACCRMGSSSSRSTTPAIVDSETDSLPHGHLDKISRRTMLAVVDYLRRQKRPQEGLLNTEWDNNFWLELNYVEVALTAQTCAAHFTALLYAEIYTDKVRSEEEEEFKSDTISKELLIDVYRSIGEPDSLYGCGGGKMLQPLARIRTYEHEALWDKALVTYDIEMNLPDYTRQAGIIQALQNFGLCHTLTTYLKGLEAENSEWCEELQEIRFQAAWRNMQWDCMFSNRDETTGPGYHESVYHAFQSLKDREFYAFYEGLKFARMKEVEELSKGSLESVYSLYPALCRLQMLGELETIGKILPRPMTVETLNEARRRWQTQQQLLKDSDFTFQEPILALRTVVQEMLIKMEVNASRKELIQEILMEHLLEMAKLARAARNTQLAEKAIFQIKQHNPIGFGISTWQLEEAQVIWAKREQNQSLDILKQMIADSDVPLYVECLRLCGNWLAETCLESPGTIMQKYLEKAVEIALSHSEQHKDAVQSGRMEAFLSLARFSDAQYQSIDNYMKSSEFENKRALLKNTKKEIRLMREHKVQANRYVVKVQREFEIDERAICALQEDRKKFLCKAVENYISCLQSGEEHDMRVFRLCSLWLENSAVPEVNSMMKKGIEKIPSYKFLPLMYQLAARMGTKMPGGDVFHDVLNMLIVKTSLDHPHHTLFIILALSNANKDDILGKPEVPTRSRLGKSLPKDISNLDQERIYAASKIINIVRKSKGKMVKDLERLCDAYITLANMDASKWKQERKGIDIPPSQPITKLKNLDDVVIPTMEIKVDPSGKYENLVTVKSFKSQFRLAGGMNLPKIIDCVGSDGRERRQLVKGRDDLRQDAVMQQVFQMCNALLKKNTDTRKRKLTIRTYKVIPLSQRSGFLEWCAGTVPIGEYLVNATEGAHKRYRPNDWSSMECRKRMTDVQKLSFEGKYKAFMSVCKNFRPVFRHFCMEKFLDPAVWFEKRLAYTRSVATSSIVCYIVGLGDRHVQNILIDEESAELVHIDLGVAFEQGKILPTPETVPFRLTRDIVDGMGITGVEGVFRRCCEKTMEVMRNSQEALLTIVEVLLYDPLFDWTMNPLKALNLQQRPEEDADIHSTLHTTMSGDDTECDPNITDVQSINKVAERVLLRLQEKLKGVEERAVLSVGGQVNLLIQQARDPKNLSRLFPGWQPWV